MVITLAFHAGNRGSSPLFGRGNFLFVSERCGPRIARCTRATSLWKRTQAVECAVRNAGLSERGECFRVLGESNPGVLLDRRGYYPLSRQPHPAPSGLFVPTCHGQKGCCRLHWVSKWVVACQTEHTMYMYSLCPRKFDLDFRFWCPGKSEQEALCLMLAPVHCA